MVEDKQFFCYTNMGSRKLFCTFVPRTEKDKLIDSIRSSYSIIGNKLFFFVSIELPETLICSYSVESVNIGKMLPGTIPIHRNPDTNTMYTLDALNALVRQQNDGKADKTFLIDWKPYRRVMLLMDRGVLREYPLVMDEVVSLE